MTDDSAAQDSTTTCSTSRDSTGTDATRSNHGKLLRFLSTEWMVERMQVADPVEPTPGVDMVIQHVVLGGPYGPVTYVDEVRDGRLASCRLGWSEHADATITNTWQDELAVMRGEMDPFDVVIEGRLEVTGDQSKLMQVIPILQRPLTAEMARAMSARTTE